MRNAIQERELLAWAAGEIKVEQQAETYGSITFYMQGGVIIRSEVNRARKPGDEARENQQPGVKRHA